MYVPQSQSIDDRNPSNHSGPKQAENASAITGFYAMFQHLEHQAMRFPCWEAGEGYKEIQGSSNEQYNEDHAANNEA